MLDLVKLTSTLTNGTTYTGLLKTDKDIGVFFGSIGGVLVTEIRRLSYLSNNVRNYIGFIKISSNEIFINDNLSVENLSETEVEEEENFLMFSPSGYFIKKDSTNGIKIYKKYYDKNGTNTANITIDNSIEVLSETTSILRDMNGIYKKMQLYNVVFDYQDEDLLYDKDKVPYVYEEFLINSVSETGFIMLYDNNGNIASRYIVGGQIQVTTWKYLHNNSNVILAKCLEYSELDSYLLLSSAEYASANPTINPSTYTRPAHSFSLYADTYNTNELAYYSDEYTFTISAKEFEIRDKGNNDAIFKVNKSKGYILDDEIITKSKFNKEVLGLSKVKDLDINEDYYLNDEDVKYETTSSVNKKFKYLQKVLNEMYIKIKGLVPRELNTLEKLSKAVNNDPNFATTISSAIASLGGDISNVTSSGASKKDLQTVQNALNSYITTNGNDISSLQNSDISINNRVLNTENSIAVLAETDSTLASRITSLESAGTSLGSEITSVIEDVADINRRIGDTLLVTDGDLTLNGAVIRPESYHRTMYVYEDSTVQCIDFIVGGHKYEGYNLIYDFNLNVYSKADTSKYSYLKRTVIDGNDPLDTIREGQMLYALAPRTGTFSLSDFTLITQDFGTGDSWIKGNFQMAGIQNRINDGAVLINGAAYLLYNCYWDSTNSYFTRVNTAATAYAIKLGADGSVKKLSATSNTFTTWAEDNIVTDGSINSKIENTTTGEVSKLVKTTTTGGIVNSVQTNEGLNTKRYHDLYVGASTDAKTFVILLFPMWTTGIVNKSRIKGEFLVDSGGSGSSNINSYAYVDISVAYNTNIINKFESNFFDLGTVTYNSKVYYALVRSATISTTHISFNGIWKTTDTLLTPTLISDYANNGVTGVTQLSYNHMIAGSGLYYKVTTGIFELVSGVISTIKKTATNAFKVVNDSDVISFNVDTTNNRTTIGNKIVIPKSGTANGTLLTIGTLYNRGCVVRITGQNYDGLSCGFIKEYIICNVETSGISINEITNVEAGSSTNGSGITVTGSGANAIIAINATSPNYVLSIEITGSYSII